MPIITLKPQTEIPHRFHESYFFENLPRSREVVHLAKDDDDTLYVITKTIDTPHSRSRAPYHDIDRYEAYIGPANDAQEVDITDKRTSADGIFFEYSRKEGTGMLFFPTTGTKEPTNTFQDRRTSLTDLSDLL